MKLQHNQTALRCIFWVRTDQLTNTALAYTRTQTPRIWDHGRLKSRIPVFILFISFCWLKANIVLFSEAINFMESLVEDSHPPLLQVHRFPPGKQFILFGLWITASWKALWAVGLWHMDWSPASIMTRHGQRTEPKTTWGWLGSRERDREENRKSKKLKPASQSFLISHSFLMCVAAPETWGECSTHAALAHLSVSVHFSSSSRAILSILCFSSSLVVMSLASWWRFWVSSSPCESDGQDRRISGPNLPHCCRPELRLHPQPSVSLGIPEKKYFGPLCSASKG